MSATAYCDDCLNVLPNIPDASVDMILCDLPYGITQNPWDKPIPLEDYILAGDTIVPFSMLQEAILDPRKRRWAKDDPGLKAILSSPPGTILEYWQHNRRPGLWTHYRRIIKPRGVIALFGTGMFSAELMRTGKDMWRYNIIWQKKHPTGFLNANRMPLRGHEDICIFYKKLPVYHPQKSTGHAPVHSFTKHTSDGSNYGRTKLEISGGGSTERFPTTIWKFGSDTQKSSLHTTQKPVALFEELIKTYTDEGALVLDNCAGSFTTAIACDNLGRNWIGVEVNRECFLAGIARVNANRELLDLPAIHV